MATAAQSFFAIPELLEQVLLELGGTETSFGSPCNPKELFTFQRVNRFWLSLIQASQKLRLRMGLKPTRPTALDTRNHIALTCIRNREFLFPPFSKKHHAVIPRPTGQYHTPAEPRKRLWLSYIVRANFFAEKHECPLSYRAGILGKSGRVYSEAHHTWRQIRLAPIDTPMIVEVTVFLPHNKLCFKFPPDSEPSPTSYTELIRLKAGEGTLGDLADFLEEIGRKSRDEHLWGEPRYAGTYFMEKRTNHWRALADVVMVVLSIWLMVLLVEGVMMWSMSGPNKMMSRLGLLLLLLWVFGKDAAFPALLVVAGQVLMQFVGKPTRLLWVFLWGCFAALVAFAAVLVTAVQKIRRWEDMKKWEKEEKVRI